MAQNKNATPLIHVYISEAGIKLSFVPKEKSTFTHELSSEKNIFLAFTVWLRMKVSRFLTTLTNSLLSLTFVLVFRPPPSPGQSVELGQCETSNGYTWRRSSLSFVLPDPHLHRLPAGHRSLRHGPALTSPTQLPQRTLWLKCVPRLISVTISASPPTAHHPQETGRQNKKASLSRLSGGRRYLWRDTERQVFSCRSKKKKKKPGGELCQFYLPPPPRSQCTAVWWQGCPLFPHDHRSMRLTSPLSSVAPSPCAGPRSKHPPSLPCSSRPCFCCCCAAWPPPWASTICASPWWARMRARCGSSTRASRSPRPWKTTCGSRWTRPGSRVGTRRRGSARWWVLLLPFLKKQKQKKQQQKNYF